MKTITILMVSLLLTTVSFGQAVTKSMNISAGNLSGSLTVQEKAIITDLTLTGTIDARDFKTMRDDMPLLANVDLGGTKIVYYYGTGGTSISSGNQEYIEDFIPQWAFQYKYSLTSIVFPPTIKSIQNHSFVLCYNLASISFPETLVSIATYAFSNCKKAFLTCFSFFTS